MTHRRLGQIHVFVDDSLGVGGEELDILYTHTHLECFLFQSLSMLLPNWICGSGCLSSIERFGPTKSASLEPSNGQMGRAESYLAANAVFLPTRTPQSTTCKGQLDII